MSMLSVWYRGDDAGTVNGASVPSWVDRSGNGADLEPAPGFSQPTLVTNHVDFNSQTVVSLDGTQQMYKLFPAGLPSGDSAFSMYIVAKPTFGSTRVAFGWGQSAVGDAVNANFTSNGGQAVVELTEGASMGSVQYVTTNDAQIFSAYMGQGQDILTQSEVLINGAIPSNLGGGASGTLSIPSPVPQVRLGSYFGVNATQYVGLIAEILVYSKEHDSTERASTLAYLSARYGIGVA